MSEESADFDRQIMEENHRRRLEREERFGEPEETG